ncbi:MAG: hypothetical protein KKH94_08680 [Candidatus Omnitrophica bacterium]|nr:hypothetical protein [Candidatus Omnitrophota bacterium]
MKSVFVETSIMVDRIFKDRTAKYDAVCSNYGKKISSQFVRLEVKKGFLSYCILLYNKAEQCTTVDQVVSYVHTISSGPARHRLSSMLELIVKWLKETHATVVSQIDPIFITLGDYQIHHLRAFLKNVIEKGWYFFDIVIDDVINEIGAFNDLPGPQYNSEKKLFNNSMPTQYVKDNVEMIFCYVCKNAGKFSAIRERLKKETEDHETKKRITAIKEILKHRGNPSLAQCQYCGDALIVVEAPDDSVIFTNNMKHVKPIAEAINKAVVGYKRN